MNNKNKVFEVIPVPMCKNNFYIIITFISDYCLQPKKLKIIGNDKYL